MIINGLPMRHPMLVHERSRLEQEHRPDCGRETGGVALKEAMQRGLDRA